MAYFHVTESHGPQWDVSRPRREQRGFTEHAAIMDQLVEAGTIVLGGPVGDDVDAGDVVLVLEAPTEAAVHRALSVDPWIGTVLEVARVEPWTLWLRRDGLGLDQPPPVDPSAMAEDELDMLLAEQRDYYRARAHEYDATYPLDESADADARHELAAALAEHAPFGRVLELACGTGQWTVELARHASTVTAVDYSPEALALCRQRVDESHVSLVQADLFGWKPEQRYDLVFFAAWLSHVPPQRFDAFWAVVAECLAPDGKVFVIDELPAGSAVEETAAGQPAPAVQRRLTTGESYRTVKVFWDPDDLRTRLAALGWHVDVREVGWRYFFATASKGGSAEPASPTATD